MKATSNHPDAGTKPISTAKTASSPRWRRAVMARDQLCETKPIAHGRHGRDEIAANSAGDSARQSQFPDGGPARGPGANGDVHPTLRNKAKLGQDGGSGSWNANVPCAWRDDDAKQSQFRAVALHNHRSKRGRSPYCAKQSQMWGRWETWVTGGDVTCAAREDNAKQSQFAGGTDNGQLLTGKGVIKESTDSACVKNKANSCSRLRLLRRCAARNDRSRQGRFCETKPICGDGSRGRASHLVWRGRSL